VRQEEAADVPAVWRVNFAAFGRRGEADLVDALRNHNAVALSLVAARAGTIVGHILFSPVRVEGAAGDGALVSLGPLAVMPSSQRAGVGSALVRAGLMRCGQAGHRGVVVLGDPKYYARFGFTPADAVGLWSDYAESPDGFMALALSPGALADVQGLVTYDSAFQML
jgi:putative acetyltransferase